MTCSATTEEIEAKRAFVQMQTRQAQTTGWVQIRDGGKIPVWVAYRCLYCGEYFNQTGAEQHFGMTREEFFAKQEIE